MRNAGTEYAPVCTCGIPADPWSRATVSVGSTAEPGQMQRDVGPAALGVAHPGSGEAWAIREIAMIADVGPPPFLAEHRGCTPPLLVGVLDNHDSAGPQQPASSLLD